MGKILLAALVVVFMLVRRVSSVDFVFQASSYNLDETFADNVVPDTIMISRSGTLEETNKEQIITLDTTCRPGVTASATSADITVPDKVTFGPGDFEMAVPITIEADDEDESRELFCLTIKTDPGSEYSIVIVIPGNDFCYDVNLGTAGDYLIGSARYVGPWFTEDSNVVEIWVTPDTAATGQDINIYLATQADVADSNLEYYGIFLEDALAATHDTSASAGDSIVIFDTDASDITSDIQAVLTNTDLIDPNTAPNKFWLKYEKSTGTISLGTDDDRVNPDYAWSHGGADALTVKHIFVSSVESTSTYIKICHPASPRKFDLSDDDVSSTSYQSGGRAARVIDGDIGPMFVGGNCFLSGEVIDPWLRIDLGMEYDVNLVLIWPVADAATINGDILAASIDNAVVYVGSCDGDDIKDNIQCDPGNAIAVITQTVIEKPCNEETYGRYVYIYKDTADPAVGAFSLCEIEVYGTQIPYGDETTVQFSEWKFDVDEDNIIATIQATRTGESLTCTSVDYYTDSRTLPVYGNTEDFTAISSLSPSTFNWDVNDVDGVIKEANLTLDNDNDCEPYETFKVYLTNVIGGTIGAQSGADVGIIDDDSVSFTLAFTGTIKAYTVSEDDDFLSIDIERSGTGTMQKGSVELVLSDGTATSSDYDRDAVFVDFESSSVADSETGMIDIKDDEWYEPDETFTVSLGTLSPPDTCSLEGQYPSATVTITDNDSQFRWDSDGHIVISEGELQQLLITREGTEQTKTVDIVIDEGTAKVGDDFSILPSSNGATSVTFPAGGSDGSITIRAEEDSNLVNDKTFTLTLRDPLYPSGNRGEPYHVTVTIRNKDAEYSWKQPSYSALESSGTLPVCLVRTGYTSTDKSIGISTQVITVGSTIGNDFTPPSSINFAAGQSEACANVVLLGDNIVEPTETFTLTIISDEDVLLGADSITTVSITDDDNTVGWSQPEYTFPEGSTSTDITITKTGESAVSVTLTVTSGTAILNNDFSLDVSSGSAITLPSGSSSRVITVTINNNQIDEATKSFSLTLSGVSTGVISTATTTVYITDDDPPPTTAPPIGLGGAAIAGIVVAIVIGAIVLAIAVAIFCVTSGVLGSNAAAAAPVAALPLSNYPPGYAGNVGGYGNGLNGYGYGYGKGLPNQGYNPYSYKPY